MDINSELISEIKKSCIPIDKGYKKVARLFV